MTNPGKPHPQHPGMSTCSAPRNAAEFLKTSPPNQTATTTRNWNVHVLFHKRTQRRHRYGRRHFHQLCFQLRLQQRRAKGSRPEVLGVVLGHVDNLLGNLEVELLEDVPPAVQPPAAKERQVTARPTSCRPSVSTVCSRTRSCDLTSRSSSGRILPSSGTLSSSRKKCCVLGPWGVCGWVVGWEVKKRERGRGGVGGVGRERRGGREGEGRGRGPDRRCKVHLSRPAVSFGATSRPRAIATVIRSCLSHERSRRCRRLIAALSRAVKGCPLDIITHHRDRCRVQPKAALLDIITCRILANKFALGCKLVVCCLLFVVCCCCCCLF